MLNFYDGKFGVKIWIKVMGRDNFFLFVKAYLCLSVWGGCLGCNCGDIVMGGLDLSG